MRNAHTTRRQAEAGFDGLDLDFDTVQDAVPHEGLDLDLYQFEMDFDALMETTEFELSDEALAELYANTASALSLSLARMARRDIAPSASLHTLPTRPEIATAESEAA